MVFETLMFAMRALLLLLLKLNRGMSKPASEFYVCLSILGTLLCLANGETCPVAAVRKPVDCDACSSYKGNYNGLRNTYASHFSLGYASRYQKTLPLAEDECSISRFSCCPSKLYGLHSKAQCSRTRDLEINRSGSGTALPKRSTGRDSNASLLAEHLQFDLPDGGRVKCSLNLRELDHHISPRVNTSDQIVLSSCRGHLPYQKETSISSKNLEIENSQSLDLASPRVDISPSKLHWEHSFLYHPSLAFLRLKNTCNESVLKVYEPISTDTQFYPFNFSEIALQPDEVTTISFVFLPKWLGSSSAELVLQTSFGGFLVETKGFAVESPHRLKPLVGLDVSSSGWLSRKLFLLNPFDETIHLEEVTTWVSVFGSGGSLLAEAVCSRQKPQHPNEHSFLNAKVSNVKSGGSDPLLMAIKPLSSWIISPRKTESILEMAFSPNSEGKVVGAICMQLLRPLEDEKDTLVVPFEAELNKTVVGKDMADLFSVSIEAVGLCNVSQTTISVSVRNSAAHLLKIVRVSEVADSKKFLEIKYSKGLLLFPGTVTRVALVTFESLNVKDYSFLEKSGVSMSCVLQILTNDSIIPLLEVPCREIFGVCLRELQEVPTHQPEIIDCSNKRTGYLTSSEKLPGSIKVGDAEADEFVLQNWRGQSTVSTLYVLDDHELLFPMVPIGRHYAKSVTVKNPSQQPVIVQLILNSKEITDDCRIHYDHLHSPSSSSSIDNDATKPSSYGFSIVNSATTEAYLHPYGTASLGPILFHPSSRCEWKSSALFRNNLSGVELLSLRGFGGSVSLVLLEGSDLVHQLVFNVNLPFPLNMSPSENTPNFKDATPACHKPLSKRLFAVNAGDFPVIVSRIGVSGKECGSDGFIVHNCKGFALEPGESMELGLSYHADFSVPTIQRDLELTVAAGVLVIPMKASIPLHVLSFCRKSIFWGRLKKFFLAVALAVILMSLLFWFSTPQPQTMPSRSMDYSIKGEKSSNHGNVKSDKSTRMGRLGSVRREESAAIRCGVTYPKSQHRDSKHGFFAEHSDPSEDQTEISPSSDVIRSGDRSGKLEAAQPVSLMVRTRKDKRRRSRMRKGAGSGLMAHIEVSSSQSGNSTPSSPLSPISAPSSKEKCSSSSIKRQTPDSSSSSICEEAEPNYKAHVFPPEPVALPSGSRPVLLPSATFPGSCRSTLALSCKSPTGSSIIPHARAPGPKLHEEKSVKAEEQPRVEDRFTYDIWGNHFSGLHLRTQPNDRSVITPRATGGGSNSFFVRGPQHTLMRNSRPSTVSTSFHQDG